MNCGYISDAPKALTNSKQEDVDDSDDDFDDEIVDKYIEKRKANFVSRKSIQEGTSSDCVSDCAVESILKKVLVLVRFSSLLLTNNNFQKLISTARELESSTSIDLSLKLAELITKLGEAIKSTESIRI